MNKTQKTDLSASDKRSAALSGVALVEKSIEELGRFPGRLKDSEGNPGGLIMFPQNLRPIIIGDLHSNRENLHLILNHENNMQDLESGKAGLIILGDALHDDRTGHMLEMQSSVEMIDDILRLTLQYPGQVVYIRGNHDSFDERMRKSGISQGLELRKTLDKMMGKDFTSAVEKWFEELPYFIIGKPWVITHAGPPRGGVVKEELINIKKYPEKLHQLLWIRVNEFHGTPSLKQYGEKDIRLALDLLDLPADTHFIVGHNPIWTDGNKTGVWKDVIGIKNHHIIQSGYGSAAPYLTFDGDTLLIKTAIVSQPEVYHYG